MLFRSFPALVERPLAPVRLVAVYGVTPAPDLPLDRRLYEEALGAPPAGLVAGLPRCDGREISLLLAR